MPSVWYVAHSTLGAGFIISLIAYYYGNSVNNTQLINASVPFLWLFGAIWLIFIIITLIRNIRHIF
jgi:hypothetical protein